MIGGFQIGGAPIGSNGISKLYVLVTLTLKRAVRSYTETTSTLKRAIRNFVSTTSTLKRIIRNFVETTATLKRTIRSYIASTSTLKRTIRSYIASTLTLIRDIQGWTRVQVRLLVPSGLYYLRAILAASGVMAKFDDGQLEKAYDATEIDTDFIGDKLLPERLIQAQIGFNGSKVKKFTGFIDSIDPDIKNDTIKIHAYDMSEKLKNTKVSSELMMDMRADELIGALANYCGIDETKRSLEVGSHVVSYAWFNDASAWTYMNQIAEAEGGRVFFSEDGILTFWNRDHVAYQDTTPVYYFTIDKNIMNINYDISKSNIKNRISVKAYPKKLLDNTIIYDEEELATEILAGETKEFWCQFSHGNESSVPALNVLPPVIGVDIMANSESDGSGYNMSSYIEITSDSIFAESYKMNIKNNYSAPVYITQIVIEGQPIVIAKEIEVIEEDTDSQALYGVQELAIENNFIDEESFARSLAEIKLLVKKDARNFIEIEVIGAPHLQIGDVVSAEGGFDKIAYNYTIVKNQEQLDGDYIQTLTLERKL
jgi:hypothetical protein